ncbi:MAG: HAMP domain-containing protein, partial [Prolixibacteraceae bacterium]|nr:HAMP domain-containing protein [Prolixibacteraceae bacterium]
MKWKKTIQDRKPGNITYFDDKNGTLDDLPENNFRSNKKEGYTNSVNESQNENIKNALKALNEGDLSVRLEPDEDCDRLIANEFNTLVSIFQNLNSEVESVSKSVGLDGDFDKRISLKSDKGIWGNFEGSVNNLITNMAKPTYEIGRVVSAVANGELDSKMDLIIGGKKLKGEYLEIGNIVNTMVDQLNAFSSEVSRVAKEVGTDGILGGQAKVEGVRGTWKVLTNNVNFMAANLTTQVRNIAEVNTAVANGDLTKKITIDARGEILELKDTINVMVDQLNSFSGEVIRVATEVGTEGKLGGQAKVEGVSGTWQVLTNTVNGLAANLTSQVRNIAEVNTAVANGDLSKKVTIDARGEVLELKNTVNTMVDQLNAFAGEVTRVAKEVGTDGVLGGQAKVEGDGGTWKDLTDNVNFMAA